MSLPANTLSSTPEPAAFLAPRTSIRYNTAAGERDVHMGPVAIGDTSQGIKYQLWSAVADGNNIYLSAPNTPQYVFLPGEGATWVALAFDQNGRIFLAWSTAGFNASYYWFDSTISNYRISSLSGVVPRVFAVLDDSRVLEANTSDVIFAYVKTDTGHLYYRQQRDRFGVEYDLGAAPATLVQLGLNRGLRLQFAFQNVQGNSVLPPAEFQQNVGGAINVTE